MLEPGDAEIHGAAPLRVVAVVTGEVTASQLWALKALAMSPHGVRVVRAAAAHPIGRRAERSGAVAAAIAGRELHRQDAQLDRLFDGAPLRDWFAGAGIVAAEVATLGHDGARDALARAAPDVIVSLAGLEPVRDLAVLAQRATLAIALGDAAGRAERQTILRGIVEGHADWIRVSIHAIEGGGAAPRLLWRARPQLAPGDSGDEVVFRAQVEAVTGLLVLLDTYARGLRPASCEGDGEGAATAGLWTWVRYVASGRGRAARSAYERALR